MVTDADIERAVTEPPQDTRAFFPPLPGPYGEHVRPPPPGTR
jgi:hypothetical protein